jgi:hypothetical protein
LQNKTFFASPFSAGHQIERVIHVFPVVQQKDAFPFPTPVQFQDGRKTKTNDICTTRLESILIRAYFSRRLSATQKALKGHEPHVHGLLK